MKNEKMENQEIENLLKSKMNELSESVDCFDKISARVFPEKNQDFSESGFIISDLENVTGKSRKLKAVKWSVIAAAAVFCIAVVPKTGMVQRVFSNISNNSTKKQYQDLLSEINTETKNGDYITMDFPLNYYIDNDVIITPLFSCPFENCGKENLNVRIFIRQIDGIYTNQVYAVEYTETFSEKNIIAAAESEYKFTPDDIQKAYEINFLPNNYSDKAITQSFSIDDDGFFIDNENDKISLASFMYPTFIKNENDIIPVSNEVLYGHKTTSDDIYFYDINSEYEGEEIQMPDRQKMWKKSIYYNGNSAMPDENISNFTITELFSNDDNINSENVDYIYISPFESGYTPEINETISIYAGKRLSSIIPPIYTTSSIMLKLYISSEFLDSYSSSITIKSSSGRIISKLSDYELRESITYSEEEIEDKIKIAEEEQYENQKELEEAINNQN